MCKVDVFSKIISLEDSAAEEQAVNRVVETRSASGVRQEIWQSVKLIYTLEKTIAAPARHRERSGEAGGLEEHPALRDLRSGPSGFEARRRDEG